MFGIIVCGCFKRAFAALGTEKCCPVVKIIEMFSVSEETSGIGGCSF